MLSPINIQHKNSPPIEPISQQNSILVRHISRFAGLVLTFVYWRHLHFSGYKNRILLLLEYKSNSTLTPQTLIETSIEKRDLDKLLEREQDETDDGK